MIHVWLVYPCFQIKSLKLNAWGFANRLCDKLVVYILSRPSSILSIPSQFLSAAGCVLYVLFLFISKGMFLGMVCLSVFCIVLCRKNQKDKHCSTLNFLHIWIAFVEQVFCCCCSFLVAQRIQFIFQGSFSAEK